MFLRKKNRKRVLWLLLLLFIIIFWRGLRAETKEGFTCQYKIIYAFCVKDNANVQSPSFFDILEAGVKF